MKKIFNLLLCFFPFITLNAQINEIGVFLGGSNFVGDVGSTTYIHQINWLLVFYTSGIKARDMHIAFLTHNQQLQEMTSIQKNLEETKEVIVLKTI